MRRLLASLLLLPLAGCGPDQGSEQQQAALAAFATVQKVFQHPRCQNCHIPGDSPLQFEAGLPHEMGVVRGEDGKGAAGLPCAACHAEANPPASYGPHAPPGAPHWSLPPAAHKMAWIGLPANELCEIIKDKSRNGDRDFAALIKHVSEDKLVLWGWNPGGTRAPVPVAHDEFVAQFKLWADAGGPCPAAGS
ncbi:hypothetical protein D3879_12525 [Pseudomonas cavernicola]|uniref:Isoquinoline 1-oxidoreductase subunit n=1 Tax=Pseudomonas cavernicola TaxID=2320866 RepID=A0A418XNG3_9PSED|nr:hypothetical protein [Pseudomonas cavernicola]RJG13998.1 hypothetical protein D3879_12525 [Pseudomonas cavernicola]